MRTRRTALNFLSGIGLTAVTVLVGVVATPFILQWLGDDRFGAYRATVDWLAYLMLLELGIAGSLSPLFAEALSKREASGVAHVLAVGIRAFVRVAAAIIVAGTILGTIVHRLVPVGPDLVADLRLGYAVGLANALLLPLAPFRLLLEARQRSYVVHVLLALQALLTVGAAVLFAYLGWGIAGQFGASVTGGFLFNVAVAGLVVTRYRTVPRTSAETGDFSERLRRLSPPTLLANLAGRLSLGADHIVIAWFLGPAVVAPFYITQRLLFLFQGQLQSIGNASWAALAELATRDELETFRARVVDLTAIISILGVAGLVPIAALNQEFVGLWIGPDYFAGYGVTAATAGVVLFVGLTSLWGWCFMGTGRIRVIAGNAMVGAIVNVVLSIALVRPWGALGPVVATLVALVTTNGWYLPWRLRTELGVPIGGLIRAVAVPVGIAIPYFIGVQLAVIRFEPTGWIATLGALAVLPLFFLSLYWLLALRPDERHRYRSQIRAALGR